MAVLIGIVCLEVAFYGYNRTRCIFNPITAMFTVWAIILFFSCWGFYGTVIPSDKVYIIIAIGLLGFLIGCVYGLKEVEYRLGRISTSNIYEYKFNYKLLHIFCLIAIIYYVSQLAIVIRLLKAGYDYTYVRNLSVATEMNELRTSAIVTMTKAFIATPITYLMLAIFPIELMKQQKNIMVILESVSLMLFYVLTTGGRSVLLWCALYFLCVLCFVKKKMNWDKMKLITRKYKWVILIGGVSLFIILLKMTMARKGMDVDFLKQMYIYFVCPLQNFDYHIKNVDKSGIYGYGLSSFYGLLYPFMFLLSKLKVNIFTPNVLKIYNMSFQNLQRGIDIGGGIYMNAFVTAFYQPYLDGRYLGVIIVMILFGLLSGRVFYEAYYKKNVKYLLIYMLVLQKIIFSYVRFYFTQQAQSICFLLSFLMVVKIKENTSERDKINIY